jgi:hypothetical protein
MSASRRQRRSSRLPRLSRRDWLRLSAAGVLGGSMSGWLETLADETAKDPLRQRSCILLWMAGGPSQLDTFDLKPGHPNGGEFKEIETAVPGIHISEHLPKVAASIEHLVPIRSMKTEEGDHTRATFHLRTGYRPIGPIHYPTFGSLVAKELGRDDAELPCFVSITPERGISPSAFGPGFLGPKFAPLVVGGGRGSIRQAGEDDYERALQVQDLDLPLGVDVEQADARLELLDVLQDGFLGSHPDRAALSHRSAYLRAVRMMRSEAAGAFQLDDEPAALRDAYGRNRFGQGCLLARRLVERGVPFVEVSLTGVAGQQFFGWDSHQDNFNAVRQLSEILDPAWATLLSDLDSKGLLDTTLVAWMGEFGRTPKINDNSGRDHFPQAWSTVLGGGGIRGGQVIGKTSDDGLEVVDRPVTVADLMATISLALGIDPMIQNLSNVGRPIRIADPEAKPLREVLA